MKPIRINMPGAKHLYDIEVRDIEGTTKTIEVEANNRNQAARVARDRGYEVCSVNMTG